MYELSLVKKDKTVHIVAGDNSRITWRFLDEEKLIGSGGFDGDDLTAADNFKDSAEKFLSNTLETMMRGLE